MAKRYLLAACAVSALAMAAVQPAAAQTGGGAGSGATGQNPTQGAQDPGPGVQQLPSETPDATGQDIVVTGSLIRGTPEDAALPVDVIGNEELAKQGSPGPVELLKNLPTSSAVLGDANQFDSRSQGAEGIATANLRGLSPQRTLVLLNSKRLVTAGNGVPAVDLNSLPQAAIGRLEVLKDGAAATYGSDAVAGVINFITRTDQEGFVATGNYRFVDGTDGDVDASVSYGHRGDNFRLLVAAGFQKRGELLARDRDFAIRPYTENPQGGWTGGGNPANFLYLGPTGAPVTAAAGLNAGVQPDSSCVAAGGFIGAPKVAGVGGYVGTSYPRGQCFTQYTPYDSLVDLEKRGQGFVDFDAEVAPDTHFEVTMLYARTTVPHYLTSPSYILTQPPSTVSFAGTPFAPFQALSNSGFFVPGTNPGLVAYRAANPGTPAGAGVLIPTLLYRPFLSGGNPLFNGDPEEPGSSRGTRESETFRVTGEVRGPITSGIDYNISATYHDYARSSSGYDSFGDRVQRALLGFGGFNCTGNVPGQNGCLYLNPFGNQATINPATGAANPQGQTALANSIAVSDYIFQRSLTTVDTELFVAEGSIAGGTGVHLPGGEVQFGVGGQYRYTWLDVRYDPNSNIVNEPCRESAIGGSTNPNACAPRFGSTVPSPANGAYAFLGTGRNSTLNDGIYAFYGELQLPVLDSLNVQASARYEDYGGQTGSTFNPQGRVRFQATDWLAFRGGIGTTFRGPTLANLDNNRVTSLQLIGAAFKPVDVFGNPALKPEKSTNISGGVILKFGGFEGTVDYYRYKLRDVILGDPLAAMVATLFPATGGNACNTALATRFTFADGVCGSSGTTAAAAAANIANISRVRTVLQNGAKQQNEGIDFVANYRDNHLGGGDVRLGFGGSATLVLKNSISDVSVEGVLVQPGYDGVGLLNYQLALYPVPKWKGQAYVDLGFGPIDMRLQGNYTGKLHDQRADANAGPFARSFDLGANGLGTMPGSYQLLTGANISKFVTADYNLQVQIQRNITLAGTITNLFDRDPPFAREDYDYEPFIGNPLGRTYKIGATVKF